jgi:hypothetical protein
MECYKEYPRSVGGLTGILSGIYLLTGVTLILGLSRWAALGFVFLYLAVHLWDYPHHACKNCYYRGRLCISFKGKWTAVALGRGDEAAFHKGMKRAMRGIYILWIYPFVTLILAQIYWHPVRLSDILMAAILIALMLMRQLMRKSLGCRACMMRESCPNVGPDPRRGVKVVSQSPAESR